MIPAAYRIRAPARAVRSGATLAACAWLEHRRPFGLQWRPPEFV